MTLAPVWKRWYRRALPAYWIFLFCVTHLPGLRLDNSPPESDKVLHLGAFGALAFLFWRFFQSFDRPLRGRFLCISLIVLIVYASLDEYLQQFVRRGTDLKDWICDVTGIVLVTGVLWWRARRAGRSEPAADATGRV